MFLCSNELNDKDDKEFEAYLVGLVKFISIQKRNLRAPFIAFLKAIPALFPVMFSNSF